MNISEELEKLQRLRDSGTLSDEEFAKAKETLLNGQTPPPSQGFNLNLPGTREQQSRQWAMLLHLSQFAGYLAPVAGMIVPIVIWQVKKDEFPEIDVHGKIVANWLISSLIYLAVFFVLSWVLIGIPLLMILGIVAIAYPIVGGLKANNGEVWNYPGSITFIE